MRFVKMKYSNRLSSALMIIVEVQGKINKKIQCIRNGEINKKLKGR